MRSILSRFRRLGRADRAALVRGALTLLVARVALWILPFNTARRLLVRSPKRPEARTRLTPWQIRWSVRHASRLVPAATCLPRALAVESLLVGSGREAVLRIGVLRKDNGGFEAHAWVESGGRIIIGELLPHEMSQYTPMPPLPPVKVS